MARSLSHVRRISRRVAAASAVPLIMAGMLVGPGQAASAAACQAWTGVQPPSPGTVSNELADVAVLSACDAWAVGDDTGSSGGRQTLTEHWDGSAWTAVPSPDDPESVDNVLISVHAISAKSVWAVGYTATATGNQTLILHWNGTAWKRMRSPHPGTFNRLYSVRAVSASDAWAVGFSSSGSGDQTLILHWNGTAWKRVPSPDPGGPGSNDDLFSVAATARTDAWAVGEIVTNSEITTLTMHWNGRRWARVGSPNPGRSTELFSVAATSGSNAWAVGDATNGSADQTLVLHWNGHRWARVTSPDQGGSGNRNVLAAVTATSTSNAWAVGYFTHGSGQSTLILHWNGTKWAHVASPNLGTNNNVLRSVAATSAGNAWAVGTFVSAGPSQTLALHCC